MTSSSAISVINYIWGRSLGINRSLIFLLSGPSFPGGDGLLHSLCSPISYTGAVNIRIWFEGLNLEQVWNARSKLEWVFDDRGHLLTQWCCPALNNLIIRLSIAIFILDRQSLVENTAFWLCELQVNPLFLFYFLGLNTLILDFHLDSLKGCSAYFYHDLNDERENNHHS